ncbi:MAG: sulfite exporter TauE/SafE family protein, partial [Frankiaceae bacterium]|nr:sulfite exporter TauE/SafE family protein [Frankiaceae bacterium]
MHIDPMMIAAGLLVGLVVGMTGMGGGALMTPILVLFFGVAPLSAVSSDLVVSLFMKPVGAIVHLRRGTANLRLAAWLCVGSVPAAFAGALALRALGRAGGGVNGIVQISLGAALLLAVGTMLVKEALPRRASSATEAAGSAAGPIAGADPLAIRPWPTAALGVLGGLVVGMTSVGSGSLIIVGLLLMHPRLTAGRLVGTDLVQAVPLVASAALGHLLFGDVSVALTGSLLLGALPGAWAGARLSAVAPQALVRRALAFVLLASGLKLVGVPTPAVGAALVGSAALAI